MTEMIDIFGSGTTAPDAGYYRLGYPRNPFRQGAEDVTSENAPFYQPYISTQLSQVNQWINDLLTKSNVQPLSLVGNIGAGKTRIMRFLRRALSKLSPQRMVVVEILVLADTGYGRASVGGMLIGALERMSMPWVADAPAGTLPIIWALVCSSTLAKASDPLANAIHIAHAQADEDRVKMAQLISRWLQRATLTDREAKAVQLFRRIDWEGELIRVVCDLLRFAESSGVLGTFYLFVDQLEDLFRPAFSELRRSRILTDLRGLFDEVERGAPIGLLLSWTPDVGAVPSSRSSLDVEALFRSRYEALYSRIQRRQVNLPLLSFDDAVPFAQEWIDFLKDLPGNEPIKQPNPRELVTTAWAELQREKKLYPGGGGKVTPRDLLGALANEVDRRAGIVR